MIRKKAEIFLFAVLLASAQSDASGESVNFPSYAGWVIRHFETPAQLPESFRRYGGVSAVRVHYVRPLDDARIEAQVFEFCGELEAFGFYSRQRAPLKKFVQVGTEGFLTQSELVFWKGNRFARLTFPGDHADKKGILLALGHKLAREIPGGGAEPDLALIFPEEKLVSHSIVYEPENLLGIGGLGGGFFAVYESGPGDRHTHFIAEFPTVEQAKESLRQTREFFGGRGMTLADGPLKKENFFACRLPQRRYYLARHGLYVIGFFPAPAPEELENRIKEIERRLNRRKLKSLP